MPIDLYQYPTSAPCRAVIMTAQHIGVELNSIKVNTMAGEQLTPEFLQMNPQHSLPTIDDDGFYLWESRAVQAYLVNKYAPDHPIYPVDPQARANIDRMLYFDVGTLYKAIYEFIVPQVRNCEAADPEKEEALRKALAILEDLLEKTSYVAGDTISLADFSIYASLTFTALIDYCFDSFPKIAEWMQKMREEVPNSKEINEDPITEYKEFLKSRC